MKSLSSKTGRFGLAFTLLLTACRGSSIEEIELSLQPAQTIRFSPKAGFAEYFELPGVSDQLRITLSSYGADCRKYVPPPPHEVSITLTVESPLGRPLEAGDYVYTESEPATDGARVLPFIRLHDGADRLHTSGKLKLKKIEPGLHGIVQGELEFLTPAEGSTAALSGKFNVRICRSVLDATRSKDG